MLRYPLMAHEQEIQQKKDYINIIARKLYAAGFTGFKVVINSLYFLFGMVVTNCLFTVFHANFGFGKYLNMSLWSQITDGLILSNSSLFILILLGIGISALYDFRYVFQRPLTKKFFVFICVYAAVFANFVTLWSTT